MIVSAQKAAFGIATLFVIAASGCGDADPISKVPCVRQPVIASQPSIRINESKHSFAPKQIRVPGGTSQITLAVPASATGSHGVAIDGEIYKNIEGGSVKPGHATSLTIALKPGKYTIYDPVGNNRDAGFKTKLIVGRNAPASNTVAPCVPQSHLPR